MRAKVKINSDRAYQAFGSMRPVPRVALSLTVCAMIVGLALMLVVRASIERSTTTVSLARPLAKAIQQPSVQRPSKLGARLSRQPDADRFRRSLGLRFLTVGREKTTLEGTLTIGGSVSTVRIIRTQQDDGERVEIALGSGPANLTWSPSAGARVNGGSAAANEQKLIERLALDSPDEFVLAQLRGAGYHTVARNVVPGGIKDLDNYSGPIWDVVNVREPDSLSGNRALSASRLYYFNLATGLIEKIVSKEAGEPIVAIFSGWSDQNGERLPTRIQWRLNDQPLMELNINGALHGPEK